ncbi:hypothetical protein BC831DRAFT_467737 [Entophlyctis helioformis]|nr:hypothetical protein BC831DRAFT_467737 [Entophlyctis helioformis]
MADIRVYLAETGQQLPLRKLSATHRLDDVRSEIEAIASLPVNAQILLTSTGMLMKQEILTEWLSAPQADVERIFAFNRQSLDPRNAIDHQAAVQMSIDIEPPVPAEAVTGIKAIQPLGPSASAEDRAQSFINAFRVHADYGKALVKTAKKHIATCDSLMQEQAIQVEALLVAIRNLQMHSKRAFDAFDGFYTHAQKEFSKHANLLQSFPIDLQTLAQIPVHQAFMTESKTLDDFVPKKKLFQWADNCRLAHDQLVARTAQLQELVNHARSEAIDELDQNDYDAARLESLIGIGQDIVSRMEARQLVLERDLLRVEAALADMRANPSPESEDRFQALQHLYDIHCTEYIPEMTRHDRQVRETVVFFSDYKANLTYAIRTRLLAVAQHQSSIAMVPQELAAVTSALNSQSQAFMQLLHVHRIAPAWGAALVEIVRRKEYVKVFVSKAREMADVLSRFKAQEERRRENFRAEIARYLPNGVVQGLDDLLPACEISVSNTKDSLPQLGRDDIIAFEQLVASIRGNQDPKSASSSDAVSKLQATMVKMSSQVDSIAVDFEKIVAKTGFSERLSRLEDENAKLKAEIAELRTTGSSSQSTALDRHQHANDHMAKQEDTIRAYEMRIKNLEQLLHQNYSVYQSETDGARFGQTDKKAATPARVQELEERLEQVTQAKEDLEFKIAQQAFKIEQNGQQNVELTGLYQKMCDAYDRVFGEKQVLESEANLLKTRLNKLKDFLVEIQEHLEACSKTLRAEPAATTETTETSETHSPTTQVHDQAQPPVHQPNQDTGNSDRAELSPTLHPGRRASQVTIDGVRRQMRILHDDVLWHAALMASMRNSMQDSHDGSEGAQSVAGEMVSLIQRLNEAETRLRTTEADLTAAEAREAVLEAELSSLKIHHQRAEASLATLKQRDKEAAARASQLGDELALAKQHVADLQAKRVADEHELAHLKTEVDAAKESARELRERNAKLAEQARESALAMAELQQAAFAAQASAAQSTEVLKSDLALMREQIEDWSIVCRLGLEQAATSIDALMRVMHLALDDATVQDLVNGDEHILDEFLALSEHGSLAHAHESGDMESFIRKYGQAVKDAYSKSVAMNAYLNIGDSVSALESRWTRLADTAKRRVAFGGFQPNDLVLFLPTRNPIAWAAFNLNAPHYFLDTSSSPEFAERIKKREWILAYISNITSKTARAADAASNPFGLADGTTFFVCQARPFSA